MNTKTIVALAGTFLAAAAGADVTTAVTADPALIAAALNPRGLTITSIVVRKAEPGQVGTFGNIVSGPVTIHDGVVMSSGSVAALGPLPEVLDPNYQPSSPPPAVNSAMGQGDPFDTPEFDDYGRHHVENFTAGFDVAAIEVNFWIEEDSQIKFDFLFGSVEFPFWTSSYTDAFMVFLDGPPDPAPPTRNDQIAFDNAGNPVQVGVSFAGLVTTADVNTAFAAPHGMIHHLTTTTALLPSGNHRLIFEIGDVNDQVLDSAVFIANLRTGTGTVGTGPSDDCPADLGAQGGIAVPDGLLDNNDFVVFIDGFFRQESDSDLGQQGGIRGRDFVWDNNDFVVFIDLFFAGCTHTP